MCAGRNHSLYYGYLITTAHHMTNHGYSGGSCHSVAQMDFITTAGGSVVTFLKFHLSPSQCSTILYTSVSLVELTDSNGLHWCVMAYLMVSHEVPGPRHPVRCCTVQSTDLSVECMWC